MGERLRNESPDRVSIGSAEISVGDEAASTHERHEAQRAELGDRERARRLRGGAQLIVICGKESGRIGHALTVPARDESDNGLFAVWSVSEPATPTMWPGPLALPLRG